MNKQQITLSRREILLGVGTIGTASLGAGVGSYAAFTDTEEASTSFTAGELDLRIDWQEHYNGELVEAFPDHDSDGKQSLEVGGEIYTNPLEFPNYCANVPNATVDHTLRTADHRGAPLVALTDVKPGDWGEITFSLHLCGNPGYVWMDGVLRENAENGITEPESAVDDDGTGELADAIRARAWYDLDCDNVQDGDEIVFAQGSLAEVLGELSDGGQLLDNRVYEDANSQTASSQIGSNDGATCSPLGKVETDGDNQNFVDTGENVESVSRDRDTYTVTFSTDSGTVPVEITVTERKEDEIVAFEYDFPDGYGACRVDVKGGPGVDRYEYDECTDTDGGLKPPSNSGGQQAGVSYVEFWYCETDENGDVPPGDGEDVCIPNSHTRCVGFEWWIPFEVGNEIQTDSVAFDLEFYTEQCRHNDAKRSQ
jgi:predicted ribosomally synthesized peptide with SipW-like signal peptide